MADIIEHEAVGVGPFNTEVSSTLPSPARDWSSVSIWELSARLTDLLRELDVMISLALGEGSDEACSMLAAMWLANDRPRDGVIIVRTDPSWMSAAGPHVEAVTGTWNTRIGAFFSNDTSGVGWGGMTSAETLEVSLVSDDGEMPQEPITDTKLEAKSARSPVRSGWRPSGVVPLDSVYFLDWPWSSREGKNMFYWVVGPPASLICISLTMTLVSSSRRRAG